MVDLSIIIVNTNERHVLKPCLRSVFTQTKGIDFEIIVIDNASTDGTLEMLANEFSQVKVIPNNENLGFAVANNRGIKKAVGKYVLLLNPDTEVLNGAIQKTVAFMNEHLRAGIAGCKLIFPNGKLQASIRSFPTAWNLFVEATFLYKLFSRTKLFGKYYFSYFDYAVDIQVDWVSGAYFLIRQEVIDKIGILDEQFYLYTEETDYCYRAKQAGFEVWFTPRGEVIHYWGGMSAINKRVAVWMQRSQLLFYQKHYHGFKKYLFILLKYVNLAIRFVVYFLGGIFLMNKNLITKSHYAGYAIYRLLTARWKYIYGYKGKVTPWKPY
jgi:GT2 family glycosyltransferase